MKVCLRTTGLAAGVTSLSSGNSTTEYFHVPTLNLYSPKQIPAVKSLNPTLLIKSSGQTLTSSGGWCSTKFSISKYNYNSFYFLPKKKYVFYHSLSIKSHTMLSIYILPGRVQMYPARYNEPCKVHCTLEGTFYTGGYICTLQGTNVQVSRKLLVSNSRVTHELLTSNSRVTHE